MSAALRNAGALRLYTDAYARLRAGEGRGAGGEAELLALPWLNSGPLARAWGVRARTFRRFLRAVVRPAARRAAPRRLKILDLGAGNGWLCYRMALLGHEALAVDFRTDAVDGLGASSPYARHLPRMFGRLAADFSALPLGSRAFDLALFNASLHYAEDLGRVFSEAVRLVVRGGRLVILDSPFYRDPAAGEAMAAEKRRATETSHAALAPGLLALSSVEYLTRQGLAEASRPLGLSWKRRRVLYPFWYEWRPVAALLGRRRPPSRFDLWEAAVP
jgi:SAM-dependent methyltransferase